MHLRRSIDHLAVFLGILEAGCCAVPLDPAQPKARVAAMVERAAVDAVVCGDDQFDIDVDGLDIPVMSVASLAAPAHPGLRSSGVVDPGQLACAIFTSGTTGRPNAVGITHGSIVNRLHWGQAEYPLRRDDRVVQLAPLTFDFSLWELLAPLAFGARLVLPPHGIERDVDAASQLLVDQGITVTHFVPSVLRLIVDQWPERLAGLRLVLVGGERLEADLERRVIEIGPALVNQYGPTEACIDASFHHADGTTTGASTPIGRAIWNTTLTATPPLADDGADPTSVPVGVGELHIGGKGLARGYLDDARLTAERFVPSFSGNGARLYRTGDLVKSLDGGSLEFVGRLDDQVKVRGVRVELSEVSAVLQAHGDVLEAHTVAVGDAATGIRLASFVATRTNTDLGLRDYIRDHLPDAHVPAAVILLAGLPRLPNGKVDVGELRVLATIRAASTAVPPSTRIESELVEVWRDLLDLTTVGVEDDFFELGGHSLLATQLIARVRKTHGVRVRLRDFFEQPTIRELAEIISTHADLRS